MKNYIHIYIYMYIYIYIYYIYIYIKAPFQQIRQKETNQTLSINFPNPDI